MAAFGLVSPALIHELLAPPPQLGFFDDEPCYSYLSPTVACRTAAVYRPPALARRMVPAAPRPQPSLRVEQVAGGVLLTTVLPGYEEEFISVEIEDGVLTLTAEPTGPRCGCWQCAARALPRLSKSFRLGRDINVDAAAAEFEAGVLSVYLPRFVARPRPQPPRRAAAPAGACCAGRCATLTAPLHRPAARPAPPAPVAKRPTPVVAAPVAPAAAPLRRPSAAPLAAPVRQSTARRIPVEGGSPTAAPSAPTPAAPAAAPAPVAAPALRTASSSRRVAVEGASSTSTSTSSPSAAAPATTVPTPSPRSPAASAPTPAAAPASIGRRIPIEDGGSSSSAAGSSAAAPASATPACSTPASPRSPTASAAPATELPRSASGASMLERLSASAEPVVLLAADEAGGESWEEVSAGESAGAKSESPKGKTPMSPAQEARYFKAQAEAKRMQAQLRGEGAPSDDEDGSIEDVDFYADE